MIQQGECKIEVNGRHIPVVAFFGTKGGVGKTTITDKFSRLVVRGPKQPNVLLADFDVHHRGLTVTRTARQMMADHCPTIHEYLANPQLGFQGAQDVTPPEDSKARGREFLVPSSTVGAANVFHALITLDPPVLVERIVDLLTAAAEKYDIDLIIVDCGPIVDPLTASAAFVSDMAFIIGQNEPITIASLSSYPTRIHEFLPEFDARRVRVILNKVRGPIIRSPGVFAAIPFTMEVVDYSEGLSNIDEIRLIYLDFCVYAIVKATFERDFPELVPGPEAVFTQTQRHTVDLIDKYASSKWYRRLFTWRWWFGSGCLLLAFSFFTWINIHWFAYNDQNPYRHLWSNLAFWGLGLGLISVGYGGFLRDILARTRQILTLKQKGGYEGLLALLTSRNGRQSFQTIEKLSEKTAKEGAHESQILTA